MGLLNTLQDDEAEDQVGQVRPDGDQGVQGGGVQGGGVRLAVGAVGQVAAKVLEPEVVAAQERERGRPGL